MTARTIAQYRAVGIQPAALDLRGLPGFFMAEYILDGSVITTAATDTIEFLTVPAYSGIQVFGAGLKTVIAGTASTTIDVQLDTTDVTGLTAWAADATAGTQLVKLATAANTLVATTADLTAKVQVNVGGLGAGKWRLRLWGITFDA
jgi:hypothetical protein